MSKIFILLLYLIFSFNVAAQFSGEYILLEGDTISAKLARQYIQQNDLQLLTMNYFSSEYRSCMNAVTDEFNFRYRSVPGRDGCMVDGKTWDSIQSFNIIIKNELSRRFSNVWEEIVQTKLYHCPEVYSVFGSSLDNLKAWYKDTTVMPPVKEGYELNFNKNSTNLDSTQIYILRLWVKRVKILETENGQRSFSHLHLIQTPTEDFTILKARKKNIEKELFAIGLAPHQFKISILQNDKNPCPKCPADVDVYSLNRDLVFYKLEWKD